MRKSASGSGVGRVTHPLIELGHPVTAVDDCAEMLAQVRGARTVHADIAGLRLDRRFTGVLLMSCLFNEADDALRQAFLRTCAAHLEAGGVAIFQVHDVRFLERAKPGPLGQDPNGATYGWRQAVRDGDVVTGTLEFGYENQVWTQTFSARVFDESGIRSELQRAGLRFDRWIAEPNWFTARVT